MLCRCGDCLCRADEAEYVTSVTVLVCVRSGLSKLGLRFQDSDEDEGSSERSHGHLRLILATSVGRFCSGQIPIPNFVGLFYC